MAGTLSISGVLLLGALAYYLLDRSHHTDASVLQTAVRIAELEHLHQNILEAESNGRAFLISGDARYHEVYDRTLSVTDSLLRDFKAATADDLAQQARLAQLEPHLNRRFAYLEALIGIRSSRGFEAMRNVSVGAGVNEMESIRSLLSQMKQAEKFTLDIRLERRQRTGRSLAGVLALLLASGIGIIATAFWQLSTAWRQREEAEAAAVDLAHHDSLTGLPNRRLLEDRLLLEIARARRSKGSFAVLCLDLDGFKSVNDEHGHAAGDALLRAVALRLKGALRAEDTVARVGGDEFVVVLPRLENLAYSAQVAQKIINVVSERYVIGGAEVAVGTSVGIAHFPQDALQVPDLLGKADGALYEAKKGGKRRYAITPTTMVAELATA